MEKATLDKSGIAAKAGNITVYNYDRETREYLSSTVEFLAVGVGIPANSCTETPVDAKSGFAVCRSPEGWEYVADHRGETVWSTADGSASMVGYIGEIKEGFTGGAPSTPYDVWDGNSWVTDTAAQYAADMAAAEQQKTALRTNADNAIAWRQDAVDTRIATAEETAALAEWKKYRVLLMRIDTSKAPAIEWPTPPGAQAS
ncbi:tail fiber assembly protein [[Enterobacter] lignolyticus]|uniref:Tail assembly chaperone gp38 n=1 Tax=Enterobacter lignolyticus (strain SCF1) TaxID=701347 RepID=E3G770_ENTLS|nr:tail fiber assembly protein [[Enterobacter] lignolyticus]ADO47394.1 tail assembly chaperone gp38 [[Enterobacter] lignolyticus SCF1]